MNANTLQLIIAGLVVLAVGPFFAMRFINKTKTALFTKGTGKKKISNTQLNAIAIKVTSSVLLGLPFLYGASYVTIVALATLTPQGHLYLWGTLGTIAILLGLFAGVRAIIKAAVRNHNESV